MQRVCARATESDNQVWLIVIIVSGFVMWCFNKSLPVLPFAPLRRAEISFVYLLITFRRDHAVFDADHAILPGPVPRHPGDRASEAHPVQEVSGRRGGAGWSLQLRLPVLLLATRVAEGRGVLGVMAVSSTELSLFERASEGIPILSSIKSLIETHTKTLLKSLIKSYVNTTRKLS